MKIIDTHVHCVVGNPGYHYPRDFTLDDLVAVMDSAGVAKAVVVQSQSGNGLENTYPCRAVQADGRGRLIAVCGGDARADGAAETLRQRVGDWGARGFRLFCKDWDAGDDRHRPLWEAAVELDVPVLLAGTVRYGEVRELLRKSPSLRVVLDHLGKPDLSDGVPEALTGLAAFPNVSLKFSSYVFDQAEAAQFPIVDLIDPLVEAFGADRLVWGSNYPSSHEPRWPYQGAVDAVLALVARYRPAQQEAMLAGAAVAVWPELDDG